MPRPNPELDWWHAVGIPAGTARYVRYLELFGLHAESCVGHWVCDFGCGPLGGVLSVLPQSKRRFAVDIRYRSYGKLGLYGGGILGFDRNGHTAIPEESCDSAFCLNTLEHTILPRATVAELTRITRPGGFLYLFTHITNRKTGVEWGAKQIAKHFGDYPGIQHPFHGGRGRHAKHWQWEWCSQGKDHVNREDVWAFWGVLRRV